MIGLSLIDLSNTSNDEEFLRDIQSWGVASSGETKLLRGVGGFLGMPILPSLQSKLMFLTSWRE